MDITINLNNIQEGKNYYLTFCLNENKEEVLSKNMKKNKGPELDNFEPNNSPKLEEINNPVKKEFKIESSFDGKIKPTV